MEDRLTRLLGDPIADAEDEAFVVFSQSIPSQALGIIDSKTSTVEVCVSGRDLTIHQSPGLLTSDRKSGTTGAVIWRVTPLFAEWLSPTNFLFRHDFLSSHSTVVELGAGVSGVVALTLGPLVRRYLATDQQYVLKLLKQNIAENTPVTSTKTGRTKHHKNREQHGGDHSSIQTLELDWELDSVQSLSTVDLVLACDTIYNESLIEPFNSTCAEICRLRSESQQEGRTICLVAQQLRSSDVFEMWLKSFQKQFKTWRIPNELLTESLRENTGFIIYMGILR
ncbi:hypothetical protein K491DRAFT_700410 [Lophiostoma macrostomum CBS 122681]|uniref:Diaminohydroxyphosphoribosylamino-pyrimidine deaminase n=1 Tax=Lophiostoma macrostomum CBS 122681 TaxID=1314788 RepID=A0A6A6TVM8_9PLEO|nr:hypothetical protein K491DRAFT_700410 [Lophiostoma macrostomum CBS 122681]